MPPPLEECVVFATAFRTELGIELDRPLVVGKVCAQAATAIRAIAAIEKINDALRKFTADLSSLINQL
jgi:hypothetical protein